MNNSGVFKFDNFYLFLTGEIEKNTRSKRGEKKKIAEELNIPPSLLSQIFSGTRKLSDDQVFLLCEFFGYSQIEKDYISLLYKLSNVHHKKLKDELIKKCQMIKKNSLKISERIQKDRTLTETEKSILYSSWHYMAIWTYVSLDDGKTLEEIAEKFNLPARRVRAVLDFLTSAELCKIENGKFVHGVNRVHIEKSSPHFRQHHNNWRIKSIQKLDLASDEDLNFTAPLSLSKKDFEILREDVLALIQNFYKVVKVTDPEEIYCINIDFFAI